MEKVQVANHLEGSQLENTSMTTLVLFLSGVAVISSLYITIPLLPVIAQDYQITLSQAAWAGSIFSIFFAAGCLLFGVIAERIGLKNIIIAGMIGLSIVTFAVGFSANFTQLLLFRSIQGALAATFSPTAITYIGMMFPEKKRLSAIGLVTSGFLMSGIIGQLISSFMAVSMNWQSVFYLFGIIYFLIAVMLFIILAKDQAANESNNFITVIRQFKVPFKQQSLVLSFCIAITLLLSFIGMYSALENYLHIHFGFSAEQTLYVRAAGIFGILLAPFTGKFASRFGIKNVLYTGFIGAIIGLFGLGLSTMLLLSIFMSIIFVAGIALIIPSMLALAGQLGGRQKGPATALYTFFMFGGASLGPILATLLFNTGMANLPFFIFAVILLFGLILVRFINLSKQEN